MSPTFLSRFTPSLMTPDMLEGIFVQRERLARRTVALIRDSILGPDKHHTLLIGPRGIGKTHFVSLVYHRMQELDELRERMVVAWLREEEWGVASFLDFLIRVLRALADAYPDLGLETSISEIYGSGPGEAERKSIDVLEAFLAGRTLLLIAENLDDLFQGLQEEGQQRLRAYLQNEHAWTILATSQSLFSGVSLQTSPFYGFFRIKHLKEFDVDEAAELLRKIANRAGQPDLASYIATPIGRARIRAVHHLAGGNPRIYVILSQFLTQSSLDDLVAAFLNAMDDLTPYYQSRMVWLSPQQRKIIDLLCDVGNATPVKVIAQRCFISQQTASSQLKMLKDWGYVRQIVIGRESYYELREPLLRLSFEVKKQRGEPVRLFVDFLRYWFSRHEMKHRLDGVEAISVLEKKYLLMALSIAETSGVDPHVAACVRDTQRYIKKKEWAKALPVADELVAIRGETADVALRGWLRTRSGLYELATQDLYLAIGRVPENQEIWELLLIALIVQTRFDEAREVAGRAIQLHPESASLTAIQGLIAAGDGDHEPAIAWYDKALAMRSDDPLTMTWKAYSLGRSGRVAEALSIYRQLLATDATNAAAEIGAAQSLHALGRFSEVVSLLQTSSALDETGAERRFLLARSLAELGELRDALKELSQAFSSVSIAGGSDRGASCEIVRSLLHHPDLRIRRELVQKMIPMFASQRTLGILGVAVVSTIVDLTSGELRLDAFVEWVEEWKAAAADQPDMELPLRLLDTAIEFHKSGDARVLLRLPAEQRSLIEPLVDAQRINAEADLEIKITLPRRE